MEQYMKVLRTYGRMSAPLKQELEEGAQRLLLQKNDTIRAEGASGDHFYIIEKGLVRAFRNENQGEDTLWFKKENECILQLKGMFDDAVISVTIEALEDCTLWAFSPELVKKLSEKFLEFNHHMMIMGARDWATSYEQMYMERM